MKGSATGRVTRRHPEVIKPLAKRMSAILDDADLTQRKLAGILGGYRNDCISRICRGVATSIPIDLMVSLVNWCDLKGYSFTWLALGRGEMRAEFSQDDADLVKLIRGAETITVTVRPSTNEAGNEQR